MAPRTDKIPRTINVQRQIVRLLTLLTWSTGLIERVLQRCLFRRDLNGADRECEVSLCSKLAELEAWLSISEGSWTVKLLNGSLRVCFMLGTNIISYERSVGAGISQ